MSMHAKLTRGGQISIPAAIRHRWKSMTLTLEDHGDHVVLRPAPEDPISAFRGAFKAPDGDLPPGDAWAEFKRENQEVEDAKWERRGWGRIDDPA